jgi:hypothetical protein
MTERFDLAEYRARNDQLREEQRRKREGRQAQYKAKPVREVVRRKRGTPARRRAPAVPKDDLRQRAIEEFRALSPTEQGLRVAEWFVSRNRAEATFYGPRIVPTPGPKVGTVEWLVQTAERGEAAPLARYLEEEPGKFVPPAVVALLARLLREHSSNPKGTRSVSPDTYPELRTLAWTITRLMRDEGLTVKEATRRSRATRGKVQRAMKANPDLLDRRRVEAIIRTHGTRVGECPPDPLMPLGPDPDLG